MCSRAWGYLPCNSLCLLPFSSSPHAIRKQTLSFHLFLSPWGPLLWNMSPLFFTWACHQFHDRSPCLSPLPSFSWEAVLWEDQVAGQEAGGQCSSCGQQEATALWAIEVTGGITHTGRCLGRSWDPGWFVWQVLGAPSREEGEWLLLTALCYHWSGPVRRWLTGSLGNGHRLTPLPLGVGPIRMNNGSQQRC